MVGLLCGFWSFLFGFYGRWWFLMVMVGSDLGLICSGGCEFQCGGRFAMFFGFGFCCYGFG